MKITVLLEYFDKQTYTLYCDFATLYDARIFYFRATQSQVNQNQVPPTGLIITGVNCKKRFREDSYYEIDIDTKGVRIQRNPEYTSYASYEIDFSGVSQNLIATAFTTVLSTIMKKRLRKAMSTTTIAGLKSYLSLIVKPGDDKKEFVRVNNIGQGNWNEYHIGSTQIPIVYDLGTWNNAGSSAVRRLVSKYMRQYESSKMKPVAVISHWDLDHYKCLLQMTPKEIGSFGAFIVVETLPTASAEIAYDLICKVPNVKILSIPTYGTPKRKAQVVNSCLSCPSVSIYSGKGSNSNSKGLIVVVKNKNTIVLLSGDCTWRQLNQVMQIEASSLGKRECHLIVPHHGSGRDKAFRSFVIPSSWTYGNAAVSVGKNLWNHPDVNVMSYLSALFKTVDRTDVPNKDIVLTM